MPSIQVFVALVAVAAIGSGCSFFRLKKDLEVLYGEAVFIPGQVNQASEIPGQAIVLLTEVGPDDPIPQLVDYRFPDGRSRFNFQTRTGNYRLMVFVDQNGDFVYQSSEPAFVDQAAAITNRLDTPDGEWRFNLLDVDLQTVGGSLPLPVDLTPAGLTQMERTATTMGVPIDFDSFRFDAEHVQLGMWEPTRWYTEVDYGFYLLNGWDPTPGKPMLLMVHGINGSPRDFESMLAKLDLQSWNVALFHYPSGIGINDNAYMLAQVMNELLIRTPGQHYSILAHSMGGLVSKRFIELQDRSGRVDLIEHFISIATPWAGHRAAENGANRSPVVAPVWKDMAPSSRFIRKLTEYTLPASIDYTMIFSHGGHSVLQPDANDGVVSLDSQLQVSMQDRADELIGVSQDHLGILPEDRTVGIVAGILNKTSTP